MGYTTDFIGHIDISPSLNEAEQAYLSAFSLTRHYDREEGPALLRLAEPARRPRLGRSGAQQPPGAGSPADLVQVGAVLGGLLPRARR